MNFEPAPSAAPVPVAVQPQPVPIDHAPVHPAPGYGAEVALDPQPPSQGSDRRAVRKRSRVGESVTAATVTRVLARAAEVEEMDAEQRELFAAVLGVQATTEALVAASLSGSRTTGQHAVDLVAVMDADPAEAGVVCMQAGRARMRAMWKLAHQLGLIGQDMPASDAKAAIALARAARDDAGRERLVQAISALGLDR